MRRLSSLRVAVFGVGGVGSWCAEALLRTGVAHISLVDPDAVAPSNINRQLPATAATVGRLKVDALRERLLAINPSAEVEAIPVRYAAGGARFADRALAAWDCIVDAIDSVPDKAHLIRSATALGIAVFSSMGAALRTDPTQVRIAPFHKIEGDGLARALRIRFRRDGLGPLPCHPCVHSLEPPRQLPVRGSIMPVTAAFGLALASLVVDFAASQK